MNAVTCAKWLKSGILSSNPKKSRPNVKSIQSVVTNNIVDDKDDVKKIIKDYDLDDYSSDDDTSLQNLTTFSNNKNDPYMKESFKQNGNSSSEEDVKIEDSDRVIVVGKTHREYHSLEVWIVNKDEEDHINSYCHHDYILSSCPLDVECFRNNNVNMAAVGLMTPVIQLWDLDEMNVVDPVALLDDSGKFDQSDAVLSLSHKFLSQNSSLLLSGSADGTVALWSIQDGSGRCVQRSSLKHSDKIQAVQWHRTEDSIFAAGSFDQSVCVYDCRTCFRNKQTADCTWNVNGEVEKILWDGYQPFNLYAATSTGSVHYFDIRMDKPVWDLKAHDPASATGLAQCNGSNNNGCLLTTSDEGKVKIWDTTKHPVDIVTTKSYKIGSIFCVTSSPDDPMLFCVGGEREMKIVDLNKDTKMKEYFSNKCDNLNSNNIKSGNLVTTELTADVKKKKRLKKKRKMTESGKGGGSGDFIDRDTFLREIVESEDTGLNYEQGDIGVSALKSVKKKVRSKDQ